MDTTGMTESRHRVLADRGPLRGFTRLDGRGSEASALALWGLATPVLVLLAIADTRIGAIALAGGIMLTLVRANAWRVLLIASLLLLIGTSTHWPSIAQAAAIWRIPMLGALCLTTWLTTRSEPLRSRRLVTAERWVIGGLYGLSFLSLMSASWSVAPSVTIYSSGFLLCLVLTLHGLIAQRWRDMHTVEADVNALLVALMLPSVVSIGLYVLGDVASIGVGDRFQGVFANPNQLGQFGMLTWGLSMAVFKTTVKYRYLALGLLPALLVVLSGSRTALGGLVAGAAILYVLANRDPGKRLFRLSMLVVLVLTAGSVLVRLGEVLPSLNRAITGGQADDSLNGRTGIWSVAIELIMESPLLGFGYGVTERLLSGETGSSGSPISASSVHQGYIQIVLELGFLGAVAFGAVMIGTCMVVVKGLGSPTTTGLAVLVLIGLITQLAESSFLWPTHYSPLVLWASLVALLVIPVKGE